MEFRPLKPSEIECRVQSISERGCQLLLYKDARADMNLLDETVGGENWQRRHEVINGNLFCSLGIKVDGEWVWKQDVGVESNTEAEKGQASDAFKRAAVNWGIGRELYTAPFVWIGSENFNLAEGKNGKKTTYDTFKVKAISYDAERRIDGLTIINAKRNKVVYTMGAAEAKPAKTTDKKKNAAIDAASDKAKVVAYITKCNMSEANIIALCKFYKANNLDEMDGEKCRQYIEFLKTKGVNLDE